MGIRRVASASSIGRCSPVQVFVLGLLVCRWLLHDLACPWHPATRPFFFLLRVALFLGIVLPIEILTGCRSITSRKVLCISLPVWKLKLHWLIVSECVYVHVYLHHLVWSAQWQALGRIWRHNNKRERWGKISSPPLCPLARLWFAYTPSSVAIAIVGSSSPVILDFIK